MTTIEVVMSVGGSLFFVFMALFGNRILTEFRGMRKDLQQYQLHMERRMTRAEVKIDQLER